MVKIDYGLWTNVRYRISDSYRPERSSFLALCWEMMRNTGGRGEDERKLPWL